jgi:hypothetical protein
VHALQIRIPAPPPRIVRVADHIPKRRPLAANRASHRHGNSSPILTKLSKANSLAEFAPFCIALVIDSGLSKLGFCAPVIWTVNAVGETKWITGASLEGPEITHFRRFGEDFGFGRGTPRIWTAKFERGNLILGRTGL